MTSNLMKVAVTTIALNEAKHVARWAEAAADADLLAIADTGSTDGTPDLARDHGVQVNAVRVRPWRFDAARNAGLALLPEDVDVVITVDLDEVLVPGWREQLEAAPRVRRYGYDYVWSWTPDGQPDVQFRGDRCHARFGYQWRHPVHEVLVATTVPDQYVPHAGFAIHHHADDTKPRTHYLPMLKQAAQESPEDDRIAHYYARELYFAGSWPAAREEFVRHLHLPSAVWAPERAQSYRYLAKMDADPERWLLKAVAEDPDRREAWVDLAEFYRGRGQQREAEGAVARALRVTTRTFDYMTEAKAWRDDYLRSFFAQTVLAGPATT